MSRFQFRAWDELSKIIISNEELIRRDFNPLRCWNKFVKMQYTGLLDKNGVKIFEGDICKTKTSAFRADDNTISVVEFVGGKFLRKIRYSSGSFGYHDLFALHCEVIGNKFEHPELLEG